MKTPTLKYVSNPASNWMQLEHDSRLLKVKNALNISEQEAKIIIEKVINSQEMAFDTKQLHELMCYGLEFHSVFDLPQSKRDKISELQKTEQENKKKIEQKNLKKAEVWFSSLPEEEKKFVEILAVNKFQLIATG